MRRATSPLLRVGRRGRLTTRRPLTEILEDRRLLAVITVNTTGDGNDPTAPTLSLRQAIEVANGTLPVSSLSQAAQAQVSGALSNPNTINFNIPGTGVQTITPTSALPTITSPVIINGYSQPGSSPNTNPITQADNAVPLIEIGAGANNMAGSGLTISAGNTTVRGLIIDGFTGSSFDGGIVLETSGGDTIAGNFIGTDPTGTVSKPNTSGIQLGTGAGTGTTIGGTGPNDRNIIASNSIQIDSVTSLGTPPLDVSGLVIEGNFIGTDVSGTKHLQPGSQGTSGIVLNVAGSNVVIGGTTVAARNVIADNMFLQDQTGAVVEGNYIGTDLTGTTVIVTQAANLTITSGSGNTIGGTAAGAGNVFGGGGVVLQNTTGNVIQGNSMGTDVSGTINLSGSGIAIDQSNNNTVGGTVPGAGNTIAFGAGVNDPNTTGNSILGNSIYLNTSPGITNILTFVPIVSEVTPTSISGTLNGSPNTTYRLEFFASPSPGGPFQAAQGKTFLGTTNVSTLNAGSMDFDFNPTSPIAGNQFITATATDPSGSTSRFSQGVLLAATGPDLALSGNVPATATVGSNLTLAFTVQNVGTASAAQVGLSVPVPQGANFVSASDGGTLANGVVRFLTSNLAAGASQAFSVVVTPTTAGTLNATASVAFDQTDPTPDDNGFSQAVQVSNAVVQTADLALTGSAPSQVSPGQDATFSLTVTTAGPFDATNVVLTDTLPAGTTFVSASASKGTFSQSGGVVTFNLGGLSTEIAPATVTVVVAPAATGTIVNQASVKADQADPTPADNSLNQVVNVVAQTPQTANLVLTKVAAPQTVTVGDNLTYTLTVTNTGPNDDTGVVLTDPLPAGVTVVSETASQGTVSLSGNTVTANLGALAVNAKATVTIVVQPTVAGTLTNTAGVTADLSSPNGTNTAAQVTTVNPVVTDGPRVVLLKRLGFHNFPTTLVLTFDRALDPASAQDVNNYVINVPGRGIIPVVAAVYDPAHLSVTLHPETLINIHYAFFVTVRGTGPNGVRDTSGNLLDGAGTGQPGSDYSARIVWFGPGTPIKTPVKSGLAPLSRPHAAISRPAISGLKVHHLVTARKARL